MTLTAELKSLKQSNVSLAKKAKDQKKNAPKKREKKDGKLNKDELYAWKKISAKTGQSTTRTWKRKTYDWFPNHGAWTIHDPKDCKKSKEDKTKEDKAPEEHTHTKGLTLTAALANLVEQGSSFKEE